MRATLDASIYSPEDCPVEFTIDPTTAEAQLSGTPTVTVVPIELEMPVVSVTVPDLVITLPTLSLEVGLEPAGIEQAIASLQAVQTFVGSLNLTTVNDAATLLSSVATLDLDGIVSGLFDATTITSDEIVTSLLFAQAPALILAAVAQSALAIKASVELDLGEVTVGLGGRPISIDVGKFRLHGVPVQDNDQRLELKVDFDATALAAQIDGVRATLKGCVVLNGGKPPCPAPKPKCPAPVIAGLDAKKDELGRGIEIQIRGRGFGDVQGEGHVVLRSMAAVLSPVLYDSWSDREIVAILDPPPPSGIYSVVVVTTDGGSSEPGPLTVQ